MSQIGFYFNEKRCVKCHACEIACKLWNNVEIGPRWRTGQGEISECQGNQCLVGLHALWGAALS
jgi:Fe-S-cluster-containing dehydrogenase component